MNLRVALLALLLAVIGLSAVGYKLAVLGYELVPRTTQDRWSVQLQVKYRGAGDNALARIHLPSDREPFQRIYDERIVSEGASFDIITHEGNRIGALAGRVGAQSTLSYRFNVRLPADERSLPTEDEARAVEPDPNSRWLEPSPSIQSDDESVAERLQEILTPGAGLVETVRHIYDYVADEVRDIEPGTGGDALSVLQIERGDPLGKARLAVALARAAGIPARVVAGLDLGSQTQTHFDHWAEVRLGGQWYPVDPSSRNLRRLPRQRLVLLEGGDDPALATTAVEDLSFQMNALKAEVAQHRVHRRRASETGHLLDRISLFTLPVQTQMTLRVLLLLPFGALIVSLFRNMVGIPTFGTFMPVLLALAFIEITLTVGIVLLLLIIGVGWVFRRLLDWLQLLMIPRLSFLLTVVIITIVGISLLSDRAGMTTGLYAAAFPIVIITATIERFSVMIVEEGARNAAKTTAGTLVVALACYALLMSEMLQRTVLAFPELLLVVLGALLLIGRYTGYRLSEWTRFAAFKRGFQEM